MSDLKEMIAGLRIDASSVSWPEAAEVRTRGDRRSLHRRLAVAAAAVAAIALTLGILPRGGPHQSAPAGPVVATQLPLDSIQAAPSGTIFAITHTCSGGCSGTKRPDQYALLRSTDLARNWTRVGPLEGIDGDADVILGLAVASDDVMWIRNSMAVMGSHDGGKHWNRWDLGADPTQSKGSTLVDTTLWTAFNGQVLLATDGGQPKPTITQPPGSGRISSVAAISTTSAIALRESGVEKGWYRTDDGGAHWAPASDPCAQLSHPNVTDANMTAGRAGGPWAICFVANGGYPGWQIATSADGGHSWQPHPGDAPGGDDVNAVSATVAWRTGNGADVYRTTDSGAHWTNVATIPPGSSIQGGFVLDANTALYVLPEAGSDRVTLHLTTNGGTTWTTLPFGP